MNFEEQLNNEDNKKIMFAVCYRYRRFLDEHDAESIKNETLWECCLKYDPNHPKKAKFTSYLYQKLNNKIRNHLKRPKREKTGMIPEKAYNHSSLEFDILNSLSVEEKGILEQSYLHNMTIEEIGRANGYSRETARRKLKKIKTKCRELVSA